MYITQPPVDQPNKHSVCTKLISLPKCSVSDRQQEAPERHRRHREIVASAEQPNMNSLCAKVISLPSESQGDNEMHVGVGARRDSGKYAGNLNLLIHHHTAVSLNLAVQLCTM